MSTVETTPPTQAVSGVAETKPLELLVDEGRSLKGAEARIAKMEGCKPFALSHIEIIDPNFDTGAKRMDPKTRQFDVPVYRTVAQFTFDPREKNAEYYRRMATALCTSYNSHSTLTEETALLKERVRVLEAHVWDALVDLSALVRDPTKDAQPSDFPARPNDADRENLSTAFNSLRRARSALHTTPEVGE